MRGLYFITAWYTTIVCTFIIAALFLLYLTFPHTFPNSLKPNYQLYKALPLTVYGIDQEVKISLGETPPP